MSAWRPALGNIGALLMATNLVTLAGATLKGVGADALGILETAAPGLHGPTDTLGYLAWTGAILAPALLAFTANKASYDAGRRRHRHLRGERDRLFQHRVLFFCLVFSGFWLMFNQVFDLLPNVIDDWVDSSGIILSLGNFFESGVAVGGVSLLLGAVYGAICGVIVLLAMRPDRRPTEAVSAPATVVAALGGGGALWPVTAMVLLAALPGSAMAELNAVAAGAELDGPGVLVAVLALPVALVLGLVDAFGSRALRVPRASSLDSAPPWAGWARPGRPGRSCPAPPPPWSPWPPTAPRCRQSG